MVVETYEEKVKAYIHDVQFLNEEEKTAANSILLSLNGFTQKNAAEILNFCTNALNIILRETIIR